MLKSRKFLFEVCANSIQSAINAEAGGADRVEICQNLEVGGITPSYGLIQLVKRRLTIPVHVLIRPRPGDFVYTDDEFAIMLADIQACHVLKAEGIVVGILNEDHHIDVPRMRQLMDVAMPLQVTFHRAFDEAIDMHLALENVIALGCSRILTIGGPETRVDRNAQKLADLVRIAEDRITIMPGGGLCSMHLRALALISRAVEFHGSARDEEHEPSDHGRGEFGIKQQETSMKTVQSIVAGLRNIEDEMAKLESPASCVPSA